jgi:flavin reductase (DIM6/NTAB) family NADH-FMN oxidoreductase RutF
VSAKPAVVGFSSQGIKDSARNAIETREFVCNFAGAALMDQMNLSSLPLPPGESEFARAGLEAVASVCVAPPRVKGVAAALECRVVDVIGVKDAAGVPTGWHFVLGDVVGVFIDDAFIGDGRFRTDAAAPVSRCGYRDYNVCDVLFELRRYSDG